MTFNSDHLTLLGYSHGMVLWQYRTPGNDRPELGGYFDPAASLLRAGDLIVVTSHGRPPSVRRVDRRGSGVTPRSPRFRRTDADGALIRRLAACPGDRPPDKPTTGTVIYTPRRISTPPLVKRLPSDIKVLQFYYV